MIWKTRVGQSAVAFAPPASRLPGSYLMPLLIVPLLKVDLPGGEGLHGLAVPVQQLDADLVLAATVPARRVPKDKRLRSPSTGAAWSRPYSPVRHSDVRLEGVHQGRAVSFFSQIYELRLQAPSADSRRFRKHQRRTSEY